MKTNGFLLKYLYGKSEIGTSGNLPSDSPTDSLVSVTYKELKDKRDAGKLTPGALYRITDYQCTTTQENTRSAGHLFDIVLLALSENKLAEEGWAMMHDSPIYDVIFTDDNIKCYLNKIDENVYNVVSVETLLGIEIPVDILEPLINEESKTIDITTLGYGTIDLYEGLTYNYFQNSNLAAWKVWYCLDNDKSRFYWADDSVDGGSASLTNNRGDIFVRNTEADTKDFKNNPLYAWDYANNPYYTYSEQPEVGDFIYSLERDEVEQVSSVGSFTPAHEGTGLPNGHGVIYRLIDEFNNDCPYDFKNILHIISVKSGDTVINYTFHNLDLRDVSMNSAEIIVYNNYISPITETFENGSTLYIIPTITIGETSNNNRIYGKNIGLVNAKNVVLIGSSDLSLGSLLKGVGPTIYIGNTEIIGSLTSISDETIGGGADGR